jgi:tripartite ATP-independent transporter DctM subunit
VETVLVFGLWFLLMLMNVPIAFSMLIAGTAFLVGRGDVLLGIPQRMMAGPDSIPILAVPFFVFAGLLMNSTGITERIFRFSLALVGHIKGSLGHVNVLGSIIFAGMSGSGAADCAGIGAIELEAQRKAGFDDDFNVGVTLSSATIGPIIPPSIPMVLYGTLASVSVGALFLGGVVPGLLMGASLCVMVYYYAKKRDYPVYKRATAKEMLLATAMAFWALITPMIILVGITLGVFTPTEAAIVTVVYALFLGVVVYRELTLAKFREVVLETIQTTAVFIFIVSAANLFAWVLTREQLPQMVAKALFSISRNPVVVLLILNVFLLIVGCFMEGLAALIVLIPILLPAIQQVGIDPVHFGVVAVLNLTIGALTPPVGTYLYIMVRVARMSFEDVVKAVLPWCIPLVVVLMLISFFPQLVLWLPTLLGFMKG